MAAAGLTIEQAGLNDIPAIQQMTLEIWPVTYTPIIGAAQVAYMIDLFYSTGALTQQMTVKGHRFIICREDGEAVGFASYGAVEPGIYKLHKLYVLPQMQGKGAGRQMLDCITADCRALHAHELRLNVNRYNRQAIGFYSKNGFTRYMDEDIDIGGGYFMNDHILSLPL